MPWRPAWPWSRSDLLAGLRARLPKRPAAGRSRVGWDGDGGSVERPARADFGARTESSLSCARKVSRPRNTDVRVVSLRAHRIAVPRVDGARPLLRRRWPLCRARAATPRASTRARRSRRPARMATGWNNLDDRGSVRHPPLRRTGHARVVGDGDDRPRHALTRWPARRCSPPTARVRRA